MLHKINAVSRLQKVEQNFRNLPAKSGMRYAPLWGLCKCAIDAGYNTFDTLKHYIDGIYLSQWGTLENYIDGTIKHALEDVPEGKAETIKIEKSKAVATVRKKYKDMSPEFKAWVKEKVLPQKSFNNHDNIDVNDVDKIANLSAETMRKITGDIGENQYVYCGLGMYDYKGIAGKDACKVGFWQNYDIPNDDTHYSYCPNVLNYHARNKEQCAQIKYLVMEMDRELDDANKSLDGEDRLNAVYNQAQKYWQYILTKHCLSIKALIYSGGKSVHALIPVDCTREEFEEKKAKLKAAYLKLYMDDSMVDSVKKTRRPWGWRKYYCGKSNGKTSYVDAVKFDDYHRKNKADAEEQIDKLKLDLTDPLYILQEVFYFDDSAKPMTLDEFLDGMRQIYSEYIKEDKEEVTEAEKQATEPMPLIWQEEEDEAGEKSGKWVWAGRNIDAFLKNVGIAQYNVTRTALGLLKRDKETHIISNLSAGMAWQEIYKYVSDRNISMAVELRDKYRRIFTDSTLGIYVGNRIDYVKKLMGKREETYFPYRNGLLVVRKDGVELKPYEESTYYGEIWDDAPTLKRDWKEVECGDCEFERFLKHMCGSELENKALAEKRYNAICAVLGYEIAAYHEKVNWAVMLTDESLLKRDGGTGKTICLKAIAKMRSTWIKDNENSKGGEFEWSNVTRSLYNVALDELNENFNFAEFFGRTTRDWDITHKFVDGVDTIPEEETPLLIFATNIIPKGLGASHERRKKVYEVSMHYHGNVTPESEMGHMLFRDWDDDEWTRFDNFMIKCVQRYFETRLIEPAECNVNMQTKQLMRNIPEEVLDFFEQYYITFDNAYTKLKQSDLCKTYKNWCEDNGRKNRDYSTKTMNDYVQMYCTANGIDDDFKKYKVEDWKDGNKIKVSQMCHCFYFRNAPAESTNVSGLPECTTNVDYNPNALKKLGIKEEMPF